MSKTRLLIEKLTVAERVELAQALELKAEAALLAGMGKWERLRYQIDKARAANGGTLPVPENLAAVLEEARKRAAERYDNAAKGIVPDTRVGRIADLSNERVKAEWRELRKTNPNAGGDGVSMFLGQPIQRKPVELDAEPHKPVKRVPTKREREQIEAEAEFVEATNQSQDFIDRICGPGSTKPSGAFRNGKDGWMT